jgi:hypothetical protein
MTEYMLTEGAEYCVRYGEDSQMKAVFMGMSAFGSDTAFVFKPEGGNLIFIPMSGIVSMELLSQAKSEKRYSDPGVNYG